MPPGLNRASLGGVDPTAFEVLTWPELLGQRPFMIFLAGSSEFVGWALTFLSARLPTRGVLLPLIAIPVSYVPAVLAVLVLRVWGTDAERAAFKRRLTTWRVGGAGWSWP